MNCLIPGSNLRVISKCLQSLAKIGNELLIEACPDGLCFIAVNQSRTTYATFKFKDIFFTQYDCGQNPNEEDRDKDLNIMCNVHMKAVLHIFRSIKDKNIEYCKMEYDGVEVQIHITFRHKHDVLIKQAVNLIDGDLTNLAFDHDSHANSFSGVGTFFSNLFTHFQPNDSDLCLQVGKQKLVVRNYCEGTRLSTKFIRSQISLKAQEFASFKVCDETSVMLSLKPFRSIVSFAETFKIPVVAYFDRGGEPLVLSTSHATYTVDYVLATVDPLSTTQTTSSALPAIPRMGMQPGDITQEDQEALESINWDDNEDFDNLLSSTKRPQKEKTPAPVLQSKTSSMEVMDIDPPCDTTHAADESRMDLNEGTVFSDDDEVPTNPEESPRTKRLKMIFARCFDVTRIEQDPNPEDVLAPDSDPE